MERELDLREVIRKLNTSKYSGLARVYVCFSSEQIQGNETLRETCIATCKGKKLLVFSPKSILSLNSLVLLSPKKKDFQWLFHSKVDDLSRVLSAL